MLERALQPAITLADRARLGLLHATAPWSSALVRDRELRVAVGATLTVAVALTLTLSLPFWLLALGPVLLGVPHLLSDVRYLVVRPGYHRRKELWLAAGLPIAAAGLGAGTAVGLSAMVGAFAVARGSPLRRGVGGIGAAMLVFAALLAGRTADLVIAQAHNFVAIALWLAWRPRQRWLHGIPVAAALGGVLALGSGLLDPVLAATGALGHAPPGLGLAGNRIWHTGLPEPWGLRALLVFAFAQSVHYGIWIRAIPDEDRAWPTPRTFRATLRALEADLGAWPLLAVIAMALGLAAWALLDLRAARDGYLSLALFHGYVEFAAIALWFGEEARAGSMPTAPES